jgi:hypothetical protein
MSPCPELPQAIRKNALPPPYRIKGIDRRADMIFVAEFAAYFQGICFVIYALWILGSQRRRR